MKVKATFYKPSGKYYEECVVDIGDIPSYQTHLVIEAVHERQNVLIKGSTRKMITVITNVDDNDGFVNYVLLPDNATLIEES